MQEMIQIFNRNGLKVMLKQECLSEQISKSQLHQILWVLMFILDRFVIQIDAILFIVIHKTIVKIQEILMDLQ